jgi:hypothetical protein
MLFPSSHAWTLFHKWLILSATAVVLALCGAAIYTYERYHRGPRESIIGFTYVVQAKGNSDEVFYEEVPGHQPEWKFTPRLVPRPREELKSDSNCDQWQFKFLSGSDKPLGGAADLAAIQHLVPAAIPPTIRWISRHIVVVSSACYSDVSPSCLYVFEKRGSKWELTHHCRFGYPALAPRQGG